MIVTMTPIALLAPQLFNEQNRHDRSLQGKHCRLIARGRAVKSLAQSGTQWQLLGKSPWHTSRPDNQLWRIPKRAGTLRDKPALRAIYAVACTRPVEGLSFRGNTRPSSLLFQRHSAQSTYITYIIH